MLKTHAQVNKIYPGTRGNILTSDGIHMNPIGDIMIAKSILKAFGLKEEQLSKGSASWIYRRYNIGDYAINLSVWEFLKLSEKAFTSRSDVPNYIRQLFQRILREK